MSRHPLPRLSFRVPRAAEGGRLDAVASEWLQAALGRPLSKSAVRRLVVAGVIRVNGRPERRPARTLLEGDQLDAAIDGRRLAVPAARAEEAGRIAVLFEDEGLIAVAKPAGLAMHATADPGRLDLYSLVLRRLEGAAAAPYLGLHHRLDRDTSGVVLFTKLPQANAALAAQFEGRQVRKVYHALTVAGRGRPAAAWQARSRLAQAGGGRKSRVESVSSGGQPAETSFTVLERFGTALLVEACPHTGRKHQIRAHLREHGTPILGDARYGGPTSIAGVEVPRVMLHARSLSLRHPLTGAALSIECGYPDDFADLLSRMSAWR